MHYAGHAAYIWVSNTKTAQNKEKYQGKGAFCNYVDKTRYSSVPNRRVGRNKRAGGKILRKH